VRSWLFSCITANSAGKRSLGADGYSISSKAHDALLFSFIYKLSRVLKNIYIYIYIYKSFLDFSLVVFTSEALCVLFKFRKCKFYSRNRLKICVAWQPLSFGSHIRCQYTFSVEFHTLFLVFGCWS
jgi:hypothetical protein